MEIIKQLLRYNTVMKKANAINERRTGNGRMKRWFLFCMWHYWEWYGKPASSGSVLRGSAKLERSRKEHEERTRASTHQLHQGTFWLVLRKCFFFTVVVIKQWYRLPREVVGSLSLEILKPQLDTALRSLLSLWRPPWLKQGLGKGPLGSFPVTTPPWVYGL